MAFRFDKFDKSEEDDEVQKFSFGNKVNPSEHFYRTPLIAYNYIDIDVTDYRFGQPHLDTNDIKLYFSKLKEFSALTLNELIDGVDYRQHFHIYSKPNATIRGLLEKLSGKSLTHEYVPPVGQFALYTGASKADRATATKSPRIYFIVGEWGIFHILFYDPFHEINPN